MAGPPASRKSSAVAGARLPPANHPTANPISIDVPGGAIRRDITDDRCAFQQRLRELRFRGQGVIDTDYRHVAICCVFPSQLIVYLNRILHQAAAMEMHQYKAAY